MLLDEVEGEGLLLENNSGTVGITSEELFGEHECTKAQFCELDI